MGACTIDPGWKIKMCEGGKEGEARKTRETQNREERRARVWGGRGHGVSSRL